MEASTVSVIGKYQIIRVLGRGGMGEVLLAHDDLGRRVAIKRPFASAAADGLRRFDIEAQATTLTHKNIPIVYEVGTQEDGMPYMAMEFVEGDPLDKLISSGKPMDLILKLSIIEQVCSGLAYAHERNIIHRDIKPANIIVQPDGTAKIIDFGIAKITNVEMTSELTQASQIIGSLHYIAPERFKAEAVDGRVDVFSAGVMLYLMLTGRLPFGGGEVTASYKIVNEAHEALGAHLKDYPPALDGIMDQALAKNPEDRFRTAEDFADALRDVIGDLKRAKVTVLFDDAERLTMENRYDPALELLDEAMKLEPSNTQVRKLRKLVREHQDRRRRSERLKDYLVKADEYLGAQSYPEAVAVLKEAQRLEPASPEVKDKLAFAEERKRRYDNAVSALAEAEAARDRGDITAALKIAERAVQEDPENTGLLAVRSAIAKQLEREALQIKVAGLLEAARKELAAQNFPAMEALLTEAEALDSSHPQIEKMRSDLTRMRETEERRQLLEEIQRRVNEFLRTDKYDQASELLNRAIEKLPSETTLHRLKTEVDAASRAFDTKQVVDTAIATARQTFPTNPQEALAGLQRVIEQMPGEERLISYERSLRQQSDQQRKQQLLNDALREAREALAERKPEKAVSALEAYQLEHGHQTDVDELLAFARKELSGIQLRALIDRTVVEARALRDERPDQAIRLLETTLKDPAVAASGDSTLKNLLEDVREQHAAVARKIEALQKRAALLRERGEIDEAVKVLQEFLATGARDNQIEETLQSLKAEQERRQVTQKAIQTAADQAKQGKFAAGFESLQAVVRAYGESAELTTANEQLKQIRSAHAQQVVSKSIETSRAALLNNDVDGALAALREANEMLEFAEPAKQADWKRIGQAAKKAKDNPPAAGAVIADPLSDLPEAETVKRVSPVALFGGIGVAALVVAGAIFFALHKQPVGPTDAYIKIEKAPAGAMIVVDGGKPASTDGSGSLRVKVTPGQHVLEVTAAGFDPYSEKITVDAGGTYSERPPLSKAVELSKAGTLVMQSNIPGFKVMVDGKPHGEIMKKEGTLTLEEGQHVIRYSNEDGTDTQEHSITIVAGKSTPDSLTLKAPQPVVVAAKPAPGVPLGSLVVETTPNAQVSVDGQSRGSADGSGKVSVGSLPVGNHSIDISLDKYQNVSGRSVSVSANQTAHFTQPLTALPPPPPSSGSLSVQTNAQAQISIDGERKGQADGSGSFNLEGLAPGRYTLEATLDRFEPRKLPINIRAGSSSAVSIELQPVKVAEVAAPPPQPVAAPAAPAAVDHTADYAGIQAALRSFEQAYDSKNMGRIQANWLNIGARAKGIGAVMQDAEMVDVHEECAGTPTINGDNATQSCTEVVRYSKSDSPKHLPKTITFTKNGGKWVMKDKTP